MCLFVFMYLQQLITVLTGTRPNADTIRRHHILARLCLKGLYNIGSICLCSYEVFTFIKLRWRNFFKFSSRFEISGRCCSC